MENAFKSSESFDTCLGYLTVTSDGRALTSVQYRKSDVYAPCAVTGEAKRQLIEYIKGERDKFTVDILLLGTDFRVRVWEAITKIPYGQTLSYGEIAAEVGNRGAARAVGSAVKANPMVIVVPCHRVVAARGIGGYTPGLDLKRKLMDIEKTDMSRFDF